jgi:hypothetical protein
MSDQFGRYELDLIDLIKSNKIKLADKIPIADKDEKRALLRQVTKDVDTMTATVSPFTSCQQTTIKTTC